MSDALEKYRVHVVAALFLLLLVAAGIIFLRRPVPQPIEIIEPSATPEPRPAEVAVYVTGAVVNPGVYFLPEDSRVQEALQAAGGPTKEADLNRVNLARRVHDEEQIYIAEVGEENPPVPSGSSSEGGLININTASAGELEGLPGIGPTLAQCIIDHREAHGPFATVEEIMDVRGIGEGLFEAIKDLITVK
ncbi:MAG: hypothetical protein CEE40_12165 [Chloroflexi bacterium B3_Chlor]|nr:MAG: hypothetical protein CEE40_12165 [Chloroflexi bacterium B3_Chlor]